jgi:hypothetical protein
VVEIGIQETVVGVLEAEDSEDLGVEVLVVVVQEGIFNLIL